jgi:hypothetical protein
MQDGGLPNYASASVSVDRTASIVVNGTNVPASNVTIGYPFEFIVLQPVARLVNPNSTTGSTLTMAASSVMRNEQ